MSGYCGTYSDIFSLGLLICTIINKGRPILQANHSNSNYQKQLEMVSRCTQIFFLHLISSVLHNSYKNFSWSTNTCYYYFRLILQFLQLDEHLKVVLKNPKMPVQLKDLLPKMLSRDTQARPNIKELLHTPYFWYVLLNYVHWKFRMITNFYAITKTFVMPYRTPLSYRYHYFQRNYVI